MEVEKQAAGAEGGQTMIRDDSCLWEWVMVIGWNMVVRVCLGVSSLDRSDLGVQPSNCQVPSLLETRICQAFIHSLDSNGQNAKTAVIAVYSEYHDGKRSSPNIPILNQPALFKNGVIRIKDEWSVQCIEVRMAPSWKARWQGELARRF